MERCSVIAYRKNYLIEEHNKKLGIGDKELEKLIKKGGITDTDNIILEALSILLYGTMSQVEYYIETRIYSNNNDFEVRKSVKRLCDLGLVHSFSFHSKDDMTGYSTCNIYALTKSGIYYLNKYHNNENPGKNHIPNTLIVSEENFMEVLNRVAFNGFFINTDKYKIKTYLSYIAGTVKVEGRFVIKSDLYMFGLANIFVIPVRNHEENGYASAVKIRAIQDHCAAKKQKRPWFIFVCEDDMHERQLYLYLQEYKVIDKAVICMTKDTYLLSNGVDPFDNLATYREEDRELISDFRKIIF